MAGKGQRWRTQRHQEHVASARRYAAVMPPEHGQRSAESWERIAALHDADASGWAALRDGEWRTCWSRAERWGYTYQERRALRAAAEARELAAAYRGESPQEAAS
jgi:hypothetical protein